MGNSNTETTPPDDLSQELVQRIETLGLTELRSLLSYIEQRIDALRTPIAEEIESNTAGEIIDIEKHGGYAIVRKHPPDPEGDGVDTDITSLYHVRREQQLDGTDSLHWAYLGDIDNGAQMRCETCGRTLEEGVGTCPYCDSDGVADADSGE